MWQTADEITMNAYRRRTLEGLSETVLADKLGLLNNMKEKQ